MRPASIVLPSPVFVGDEEVDARQPQRLAQRFHLVSVDADSGPERRLEKARVGRGDAVPAQRVKEGRELPRRVEALGGEVRPAFILEDQPVELVVPEDGQGLSLGIVVSAGEPDDRRLASLLGLDDLLDQPPPGAHLNQLADSGCAFGKLRRRGSVHASVTIVCVFTSIVVPSVSCIPNRLQAVWQALAWSTSRYSLNALGGPGCGIRAGLASGYG